MVRYRKGPPPAAKVASVFASSNERMESQTETDRNFLDLLGAGSGRPAAYFYKHEQSLSESLKEAQKKARWLDDKDFEAWLAHCKKYRAEGNEAPASTGFVAEPRSRKAYLDLLDAEERSFVGRRFDEVFFTFDQVDLSFSLSG